MYFHKVQKNEIAPVAQLDRVPDYESEGRGFESRRAHHFIRIVETLRNQGFFFLEIVKFLIKIFVFGVVRVTTGE